MNQVATQVNQPPSCFGQEWEAQAPECAGGLDHDYTDSNGGHIRPPCRWFTQCGTRTQAMKNMPRVEPSRLVPPSLLRGPLITPPPAVMQPSPLQQLAHNVAAMQRPVMTPAPQQHQLANYLPTDYRMPAYLTVPEPLFIGESIWRPLGRELLRAALKAAGHTLANFVDRVIFSKREP